MSRAVFRMLLPVVCLAAGPLTAGAQTTGAEPTEQTPGQSQPNLEPSKEWPTPVTDSETYGFFLVDLLEYRALPGSNVLRWDTLGWRGGDVHRFWFKSEGRAPTQTLDGTEVDAQALYGRLIAPYYDVQVGLRYELRRRDRDTASRVHFAFGLQGLLPYQYEIEPVVFISQDGDVAARVTASRDLLLTQRWFLQARFEANAAVQAVQRFGVGSGLNDLALSLRVRHEFRREFAPYAGVSWGRSFGEAAEFARRSGDSTSGFSLVAGLRTWF